MDTFRRNSFGVKTFARIENCFAQRLPAGKVRHGKPTSSSKATLIRPSCYAAKARSATTPAVVTLALRATMVFQGFGATLNWTGGVPPYRVRRATNKTSGDWIDDLTNTVPPVTLTLERQAEFYRIIGQ